MPIRHGLPAHLDPDTIRADDRRDTDTGSVDRAPADDHTWPFYPMDQIEWLEKRLVWPTLPTAVLDPSATLPDPEHDRAEGGLSVPYVMGAIGPKNADPDLVDRVWRYVVAATRAHRGPWNLYALGLARQGLHRLANRITLRQPPTVKRDVQHVMAAELLIEIHRTEPDDTGEQMFAFDTAKPYLFARLRDHCGYVVTGKRWARINRDRKNLDLDGFELLYETLPGGNARSRLHHLPGRADAYQVLARLVSQTAGEPAGQKVTEDGAALIALTRLIGYPMSQAADLLGLTEPAARMRQSRAVKVVTEILTREQEEDLTRRQ